MSEEIKHPHSHQKLDEIRKGSYESERTVADQQKGLEHFHVKDPASNPPASENLRKEYINVQPPATATHPDDKGLWDYKELRENTLLPDAHFVSGLTGEDRSHGARSQSHKSK